MSSIPQNHFDENDLIDCVQRFFSKHHVGNLLARCNGMKEKGVSPVSLLRYKLSNIFVGRSMYILSTRPRKMTVDIFPQKKNPGIQATLRRLSEYPEILYSKPFFTIYFCTFDSNTTDSTCLVPGNMSTAQARTG